YFFLGDAGAVIDIVEQRGLVEIAFLQIRRPPAAEHQLRAGIESEPDVAFGSLASRLADQGADHYRGVGRIADPEGRNDAHDPFHKGGAHRVVYQKAGQQGTTL